MSSDNNNKRSYDKIEWENIYYMLIYAFDEFPYLSDGFVSFENVDSVMDLLATLLDEAFQVIYNQQILRQYSIKSINTNRPKGHINLVKSYQTGLIGSSKLNCDVFVFDINNIYNQAIKAGFLTILEYDIYSSLSLDIKLKLIQDLDLLSEVTSKSLTLELIQESSQVPLWYRLMRAVLQMIYENCLASDKDGEKPLYKLSDEKRLCWIFEKFIRNYSYREFGLKGKLYVDPFPSFYREGNIRRKQTPDLLLEDNNNALIIDMKWYKNEFERGDIDHRRQIEFYMTGYKSKQKGYGRGYNIECVNGLLLYADSNTKIYDAWDFYEGRSENKAAIYWQTIGLKQKWEFLLRDLNDIFYSYKLNPVVDLKSEIVEEKSILVSDKGDFGSVIKSNSEVGKKPILEDLKSEMVVKEPWIYHVVLVGKGYEEVRHAEGVYDFSTNIFRLSAGAELCPPELYVDSYVGKNGTNGGKPTYAYNRFLRAVKDGDIVNNVTTRDLIFEGPSTPCCWYMGRPENGFTVCITDDGRTLVQVREDLGISVVSRNRG